MSTHVPRRTTHVPPPPRKRKERDPPPPPPASPRSFAGPKLETFSSAAPPLPDGGHLLLAGFLAHEFLSKGTLLGQKFEVGRPVRPSSSGPVEPAVKPQESARSYADVARLLKGGGVHIPGVVNPTQLGRWVQEWYSDPSRSSRSLGVAPPPQRHRFHAAAAVLAPGGAHISRGGGTQQ